MTDTSIRFTNDQGDAFQVGDRCWVSMPAGLRLRRWRRAKVDEIAPLRGNGSLCYVRLPSGRTRVEPSQIRKRRPG